MKALILLMILPALAAAANNGVKYFRSCKAGDLTSCAATTRNEKTWKSYRNPVTKILRAFCTKRKPEYSCVVVGGMARDGLIDREPARTFLEAQCAAKNGEACFGRFSMELIAEPPHGFRIGPDARPWLDRGCALGHVSSCEQKKRLDENPDARLRGD